MEFKFHDRHAVTQNGDYCVVLDELRRPSDHPSGFDQLLIAHIDFYDFDKRALLRLAQEYSIFRSVVECPIFAYCDEDEEHPEKWERFVQLFGFEQVPDASIPASDGRSRPVFVSHKAFHEPKDHNHFQQHDESLGAAGSLSDAGVSDRAEHLQFRRGESL